MGHSTTKCCRLDRAPDQDEEAEEHSFDISDPAPVSVCASKRQLAELDLEIASRLVASVARGPNSGIAPCAGVKGRPRRPAPAKALLRGCAAPAQTSMHRIVVTDDAAAREGSASSSSDDDEKPDEALWEGRWATQDGRRYAIERRGEGLVFSQGLEASGRQVEGFLVKAGRDQEAKLHYADDGTTLGTIRMRLADDSQSIKSSFKKRGERHWRSSTSAFKIVEPLESEICTTIPRVPPQPPSIEPSVAIEGTTGTDGLEPSQLPDAIEREPDIDLPAILLARSERSGAGELEGWLLKRRNENNSGGVLMARAVSTFSAPIFWKRRYFFVNGDSLSYWTTYEEFVWSVVPRATFALRDIDEVTVTQTEITVHFSGTQARACLNLRAQSMEEASCWCAAIKKAAAAQLRLASPPEWDTHAMLGERTGPVRLVAKVPLPTAAIAVVQRLLDHSFVCKRTRDRCCDVEVPLRLEVTQVTRVQNSSAWCKYSMAVDRMRISRGPNGERLKPEVLTATCDDPVIKEFLGELCEDAHEHWLFHGTTGASVQGIADRDFLMNLAGTHRGTLYGKGVYLAECSSKADEYAEEDDDGLCTMLICRVVLGHVLVDTAKSPGADIVARTKAGYDSLCGDRWTAVGTFREFVLYDSRQVYPAYIVHYKRTKQADLFRAIGIAAELNDGKAAMQLIPHAARLTELHPDPVVRYRITMLLGAHTEIAVRTLTQALSDERRWVRRTAAASLGQLGALSASKLTHEPGLCPTDPTDDDARKSMASLAVPALTFRLRDECQEVRCASATALEQFGFHAASAVLELKEALSDAQPDVKAASAMAIAQLGKKATPCIDALIACLSDEVASVRMAAASALGHLGSVATLAVPSLLNRLGDLDLGVRQAAAAALGRIAHNSLPAVEALGERLLDNEMEVRAAATKALGLLGAASKVKALTQCLKDGSSEVRTEAATALGQFGSQAAPCVPAMIECLNDSGNDVRRAATVSLGLLAPYADSAVPALIYRSLKDMSDEVRTAAAVALSQLGALGQFGNNAASAEAALTERLKDPCDAVRKAASTGLTYYKARC